MPSKLPVFKSLADLKQVQKELTERRAREAEAAAQEAARSKKRQADQSLFARAIGADTGATRPLRHKPVVVLAPVPPEPIARQHLRDEAQALREALVTRDRKTVYRIDDGIPVLLAEEGIATAQVADFPKA